MYWDFHRCVTYAIIVLCGIILLAYSVFHVFKDESHGFRQQLEERNRELRQVNESTSRTYTNEQWLP